MSESHIGTTPGLIRAAQRIVEEQRFDRSEDRHERTLVRLEQLCRRARELKEKG